MSSTLAVNPAILELEYVDQDSKPLSIDCQTKDAEGVVEPLAFDEDDTAILRAYDIDGNVTAYSGTIAASTITFDLSANPGDKPLVYDIQLSQGGVKRTILAGNLNFVHMKNPGGAGASFQEPTPRL